MPYCIRLLSTSEKSMPASELAALLKDHTLTLESGSDAEWGAFLLAHADGRAIAAVERGVATAGSTTAGELGEFMAELEGLKPASGAAWLRGFLPTVKTLYTFQVLSAADADNGWSAIDTVRTKLWNRLGGIFQADAEGFTNEDGYQIVWQFSDRASGDWWMGLRQGDQWIHFQMDLGDQGQRDAFLRGDVPAGASLAE